MDEEWRDIAGYEGMYQVSNLGRIKSLPRLMSNSHRTYVSKERILTPKITRLGYTHILLCKNGIQKDHTIHRIVLIAFLGEQPLEECNHKNGNRSDNRLENLEWVTRSQNLVHAYRVLGRQKNNVKLTQNQIDEIRSAYANGKYKQQELADLYGVHNSTISLIINRKLWP